MSGGSYDYVYNRINDIELRNVDKDPRRAAFQKLLKLVAKAMHEIEWVDSCDCGPGDEYEAIDACLAFGGGSPEIIMRAAAYERLMSSLKERLDFEQRKHPMLYARWCPARQEFEPLVQITRVPSDAPPGSVILDQKEHRTSVRTYTGWDTVCAAKYGDKYPTKEAP